MVSDRTGGIDKPSVSGTPARRGLGGRPKALIVLLGAAILIVVGWPFAFTVVRTDQAAATDSFDPVTYVNGVWDRITTTVNEKAADAATILSAITPDTTGRVPKPALTEVTNRYGLITVGEAHVYMLRFSGTVTSVSATTSLGTMEVTVDGYSGPIKVEVYIGPRLPSDESSIRDAVGFISFGDFKEQTEYGKVAAEINSRVAASLGALDRASLQGKKVTVTGAMTVRTFNLLQIDMRKIRVLPLTIEVN